jgi:hypothetical protein
MVCEIFYNDDPLTAVQFFNLLRMRYDSLNFYYLDDREAVVIPVDESSEEKVDEIRELALRKGLLCSDVSASWPEFLSDDILAVEPAGDFLVVREVRGKYMQTAC